MQSPIPLIRGLCLLTLFFVLHGSAQENLRAELFRDTDKLMAQANVRNASFYAPASYQKATQYYKEGEELFAKGREIEQIRDKLKNAAAYFSKSLDQCKTAESLFSGVMETRSNADSAGAAKSARLLWTKAEEQFAGAARSLEDGDSEGAKRSAEEARATYRDAEVEAVQSNYLSPARAIISQADREGVRDVAPKTLAKAHDLAAQVEALLRQNHYDADQARRLARQARDEAAHSLYLAETIRSMKSEGKTFEDALLAAEAQIDRLAAALGLPPRPDSGLPGLVSQGILAVKERDAKATKNADQLRLARDELSEKDNEIESLRRRLSSSESRPTTPPPPESAAREPENPGNHAADIYRQISTEFVPEEGSVLREGDNVVIRLSGLDFPAGKYAIGQEYYPLLTKVQDAVKKFSKCSVMIEGHADSQGGDEANQALAENRAKAVAEYLMANMGVELAVHYHGYGKGKAPVHGDAQEARANNRIDVVITPELTPEGK